MTPAEPVVRARPTEQGEGLQIMVYTRDVPDLFVAICAYFAAKSLSIQDARIHTTRHGWALDSFIAAARGRRRPARPGDTGRTRTAERLKAPAATAQQPAHTSGYYGARQSRVSRVFPVMPQAELQPDERSKSWRLSVTATDRAGTRWRRYSRGTR